MSILGTLRSIGEALGLWKPRVVPIGCSMGRVAFRQTKRAARLANLARPSEPLKDETQAMLRKLFPDLDVSQIRVRRGCRLPANRFDERGSIYAMTFGNTIYWRDKVLDEADPTDLVELHHRLGRTGLARAAHRTRPYRPIGDAEPGAPTELRR